MNNKISDKDKKDWETFYLTMKNYLINLKLFKKEILQTKSFDLHGYTLEDANKKVEDLIINSYHEGVKKLIVTGKVFIQKMKDHMYLKILVF